MSACATIVDVRGPRPGGALSGVAAAVRARPLAAATVTAALVLGMAWVAAGSSPQLPDALAAVPSPVRVVNLLADEPGDVRRGRCATCGVVVGIRESPSSGFEFTVRLRGGSTRISNAATRGTWHIGDAVMLMGGVAGP